MNIRISINLKFFLLGGLLLLSCSKKENGADIIITNATIYTVDEKNPWAEVLAIKDGKIIYVGSKENVQSLTASNTQFLDYREMFVMPAFYDMHCHLLQADAEYPTFQRGVHTTTIITFECSYSGEAYALTQ